MHWILNQIEFVEADCDIIVTANHLKGGDADVSIPNRASYHDSYIE
jgi:hypothetical protein